MRWGRASSAARGNVSLIDLSSPFKCSVRSGSFKDHQVCPVSVDVQGGCQCRDGQQVSPGVVNLIYQQAGLLDLF
jgi:hypothetical protein